MSSSHHTIRKQTLQFQYNGNADGFALQKEVSDWCNFTLIPEIEQQLDALEIGDKYFTINKLEIEATVDSNDWKQKISNELIFSLKNKLSDYKPLLSEIGDESVSRRAKLDELILFFFENGYLPWWGKTLLDSDFKTVFNNWISDEMSVVRAEFIRGQLEQIISKDVLERIINQVPQKLYFRFLHNIYMERLEILGQVEPFLEEEILNNISSEKEKLIRKRFYSHLLKMLIEKRGEINSYSILQFVYNELKVIHASEKILSPKPAYMIQKQVNPVVLAWHELLLSETKKQKGIAENETLLINKQLQENLKTEEIQKKEKPPEEFENEIAGTKKQLRYNKIIDKLTKPDSVKKSKEESITELQEGIFIDNAGAVIFAAFIPALFKKLELETNGHLVNHDLAVLIIQYCVSGHTEIAEYELVLPKILCGLEIEIPVNTNIRLTEEQMSEANEMLQSLIEYWSVLKNTSINGLRESFFMRSGKLRMNNNEWLLQVEQKPFDMLLQQLPWSISMIKLPWMKNLLKTEWV